MRDFVRRTLRALPRVVLVEAIAASLLVVPAMQPTETRVLPPTVTRTKSLAEVELKLDLVAKISRPTALAVRNGDDALYVASKRGVVYALRGGQPQEVLDVGKEISSAFEQGLLGLAFTPDSRLMIVNFTNKKDESVTRAYRFRNGRAVRRSARNLLVIPKPHVAHNAGNLAFGPDDYLYLTIGDGGLQRDPTNNAQSLNTLLGKVLRIEVLPNRTYQIPSDNPFVGRDGVREEIWAYGLRNPWRFSFDRLNGDLWIADVGYNEWEEINHEPFGARGGRNYGWNIFEGRRMRDDAVEAPARHVSPAFTYPHAGGACSVTGGFVYRGTKIDGLDGVFVFSDFCKGGLEGIRVRDNETVEHRRFDIEASQVSTFGQDLDGELYVASLTRGAVYRLAADR